ncbi:ATP-dependent DNA helicase [Trichonephila clavipes]|nr:ATP-dependent DNA helicase [Trichonephila clavipes]
MVFGDLFQLLPTRRAQAFYQSERFVSATHLWRFVSLVELKENMLQQGDTPSANFLNALRIVELKALHFAPLESKMLTQASGDFDLNRAIRI